MNQTRVHRSGDQMRLRLKHLGTVPELMNDMAPAGAALRWEPRPMRIFFDVDDTLIAWDGSLRPHTREVFRQLIHDGHSLYLWSGAGIRTEIVRQHRLHEFINDCFLKPTYDYVNRMRVLGVPFEPDLCVDDHSGIVKALGGVWVSPYLTPSDQDAEMQRVYEEISQFANGNGTREQDHARDG